MGCRWERRVATIVSPPARIKCIFGDLNCAGLVNLVDGLPSLHSAALQVNAWLEDAQYLAINSKTFDFYRCFFMPSKRESLTFRRLLRFDFNYTGNMGQLVKFCLMAEDG
ncbi:unnamed protein product [Schistocephalus solidus]|uniref:FBD domain-containing protein n=1 Tax=Schistocephalus solidus TaxID=70667 RepID=A0A183SID5_SCHSO|nr:unnamed protein product [Schistocephalus solidus]